tara:strand:+ start:34 stop:462 length:429 start_codon:yes stop_codon:yes gene_type:complete
MNINNIFKILIVLITILFAQLQFMNLKAEDVKNLDDEELPAIDPFAGGTGATNQSGGKTSNQPGQSNGLLNNMRLVGTVIGESKKIAIFSAPDGGAFKYEENEMITDSTILIDVFSDLVIVQDQSNSKFEVYMNNVIKPSDG